MLWPHAAGASWGLWGGPMRMHDLMRVPCDSWWCMGVAWVGGSRAHSHDPPTPPRTRTHRPEMVVGWYHSHPGFGCWLSGVDINTQQSFEALNQRAVSVVIDPVQSVKGKVVIDAFRLISPQTMMLGQVRRARPYTSTASSVGVKNGRSELNT
jgi:proteasome lid subunit RPN8/RPN11